MEQPQRTGGPRTLQEYCSYFIFLVQERVWRNACVKVGSADVSGELGNFPTFRRAQRAYPIRRARPRYLAMLTARITTSSTMNEIFLEIYLMDIKWEYVIL